MSVPEADVPPAYYLDTREVLSFVVVYGVLAIIVVNALLYIPGFSSLFLFCCEAALAGWWWFTVPRRVREWRQLREFKKSIPDGMKEK